MKLKVIITITLVALVLITIFNLKLVPLRHEISDMEIVMLAGMDKTEDGYEISFLKRESSELIGEISTGGKGKGTQVVTIKAENYNLALRHLQTMTDKYITMSHIKYYIIGEDTAKEDLPHVLDTIARGYQTRLNSKVYVSQGMSAKEFLEVAAKSKYKVEDKLKNMEDNFWSERVSVSTDLELLGKSMFNKTGSGVVASLKVSENTSDDEQDAKIILPDGNNSTEIPFDFGGVGIIYNMNVVGFLSPEQTIWLNYIKKDNNVNVITINNKENKKEFVTFGIEQLKTKVDFNFDKNYNITEIVFDTDFVLNYEEIKMLSSVFTLKDIDYYEKSADKIIKDQILQIYNLELDKNIDFLNLEEKLEMTHPLVYKKSDENILDRIKNAKVTVNVTGKIQTTYDVTETNKYQGGKGK